MSMKALSRGLEEGSFSLLERAAAGKEDRTGEKPEKRSIEHRTWLGVVVWVVEPGSSKVMGRCCAENG
jgi:hypothetical protein